MSKNIFSILVISCFLILGSACKSEYEKLRVSNDTTLVMKKAFEYYENEDWHEAQTLFERAIGVYKGRPEAEKAYFYYAYTHYHLGSYMLANYYFKNFTNTYPNSASREEADYMEHYSHYRMSPSFRLDQTYTQKAIEGFQLFINTYPTSERVKDATDLITEMRKKLEKKAFMQAELYYDLKKYESATTSFQNLLKDFPDSPYIEKVRFLTLKSYFNWAENSVFAKQEERYNKTIRTTEQFLRKHASSKYSAEAQNILNKSKTQLKVLANVRH